MAKATTDWKSLKHARGSAAKVPAQIEALAAPKPDKRFKAFQELGEALYSDRQFYPGGAAAVPLLLNVLRDEKAQDRQRVFMLLANIATSNHALFVPTGVAAAPPDLKALLEGKEAQAARKAVLEGLDVYLGALESKDDKVRSGAAFLLAFLPEATKTSAPALQKRVAAEKDAAAKASALLAIGQLLHGTGEGGAALAKSCAESEPPLVRGAAALAVAHVEGDKLPDGLAGAVEAAFVLRQVDAETFLWRWGRVDQVVTDVLSASGARAKALGSAAIRSAISHLGEVPIHDARLGEWPSAVLSFHFTQDKLGQYLEASSLTEEQRQALVDLSQRHLFGWFAASGVPAFLHDRRQWLGLEPAGPMEAEIEVDGKKRPVFRVLLAMHEAKATDDAVDEVLRQRLDAVTRLGVYAELSVYAYEIRRALPEPHFLSALHDADKDAAPWAERFIAELMGFPPNRARTAHALIAALWPLVRAGKAIGPEMDALIPVGGPSEEVRAIIGALPVERREPLVLRPLNAPMAIATPAALRLVLPLFDLVRTPAVAEGIARQVRALEAKFNMLAEDKAMVERVRELAAKEPLIASALAATEKSA